MNTYGPIMGSQVQADFNLYGFFPNGGNPEHERIWNEACEVAMRNRFACEDGDLPEAQRLFEKYQGLLHEANLISDARRNPRPAATGAGTKGDYHDTSKRNTYL